MDQEMIEIRLKGGPKNGEPLSILADQESIELPFETHLSMGVDGTILICRGQLVSNWFLAKASVYRKQVRAADEPEYTFVANREIVRCAALSRRGQQCQGEAIRGALCCPAHAEQQPAADLVRNPCLLKELREIAAESCAA